jgi:tRNA(His) guanylyltransferase
MRDDLGDRMKMYEGYEADRKLLPLLPVIARLDGRSFHNFTKGLERPFSQPFSDCMIETTVALVEETGASIGYTQSDEITLAWHSQDLKSQIWFNGRVAKMTSQLAAVGTLHFYRAVCRKLPEYANKLPTFDARVWNVPTQTEGANAFAWREWDATKNSVSMAASSHFSHTQLHGKSRQERLDMLLSKGVVWESYSTHFKRGSYVQRKHFSAPLTPEQLITLPEKHFARLNPDLIVERSEVRILDMPVFTKISNPEAVVFNGADPKIESDASTLQPTRN